jgi:hypothetical protein
MTALPLRRNTAENPERLVSIDWESAIYRDGSYLKYNPSWHAEESPFKVRQILRMVERQRLTPKSICDSRMRRGPSAGGTATPSLFGLYLLGLRHFS